MYARGKSQKPIIQLRKESMYPAIIQGTINEIFGAETVDVRVKMTSLSDFLDTKLGMGQQYYFWTKFWRTTHEMKLNDYDAETQNRLAVIRDFATERMDHARSLSHPLY